MTLLTAFLLAVLVVGLWNIWGPLLTLLIGGIIGYEMLGGNGWALASGVVVALLLLDLTRNKP